MPWSGKIRPSQIVAEETKKHADLVMTIGLDAWREVVQRMPVDTGRARASTNFSVGSPDTSIKSEGRHGAPSTPSASATPFPVVYVTNAVPYTGVLENGSSSQAPNGMFRLAVGKIRAKYG